VPIFVPFYSSAGAEEDASVFAFLAAVALVAKALNIPLVRAREIIV
jgi:hypothetical protein